MSFDELRATNGKAVQDRSADGTCIDRPAVGGKLCLQPLAQLPSGKLVDQLLELILCECEGALMEAISDLEWIIDDQARS